MAILHSITSLTDDKDAAAGMAIILQHTISSALDITSNGWFSLNSILPNQKVLQRISHEGEDGDMYFLQGLAKTYRLGGTIIDITLHLIKVVLGVH
ncbi:hypothetical protein V5O48_013960, partial [Marasmius crinis-equi]